MAPSLLGMNDLPSWRWHLFLSFPQVSSAAWKLYIYMWYYSSATVLRRVQEQSSSVHHNNQPCIHDCFGLFCVMTNQRLPHILQKSGNGGAIILRQSLAAGNAFASASNVLSSARINFGTWGKNRVNQSPGLICSRLELFTERPAALLANGNYNHQCIYSSLSEN